MDLSVYSRQFWASFYVSVWNWAKRREHPQPSGAPSVIKLNLVDRVSVHLTCLTYQSSLNTPNGVVCFVCGHYLSLVVCISYVYI